MKRALAERAKQQTNEQNRTLQSQIMTACANNDEISVPPRKKISRAPLLSSSPVLSSMNNIPSVSSTKKMEIKPIPQSVEPKYLGDDESKPVKAKNQKKRIRPGARSSHYKPLNLNTEVLSDDDAGSNGNSDAFYLKHQNRALACELYNYKHRIICLEEERNIRRQECRDVANALGKVESCWRKMEIILVAGLNDWKLKELGLRPTNKNITGSQNSVEDIVYDSVSTGTGTDVEATSHLINSLSKIASSPFSQSLSGMQSPFQNGSNDDEEFHQNQKLSEDELSRNEELFLNSLSKATSSFSKRCSQFQHLVLELIRHLWSQSGSLECDVEKGSSSQSKLFQVSHLHEQISTLQFEQSELEKKMEEVAIARDYANASEHRIRTGLYRVANGRLKIEEVLKAVEEYGSSPVDSNKLQDILSIDIEQHTKDDEGNFKSEESGVGNSVVLDGEIFNRSDITKMKKQIKETEAVVDCRDKQILELIRDKEIQEKKINRLISNHDVGSKTTNHEDEMEKSLAFVDISSKLKNAEITINELKEQAKSVRDRWAITKGDLKIAKKSIHEIEEKYKRRLNELASASPFISTKSEDASCNTDIDGTRNEHYHLEYAKKMIEMENKLKHALENIRQSEILRTSLSEANTTNQILRGKVAELEDDKSQIIEANVATSSMESSSCSSEKLCDETTKECESLSSLKEKVRRMKKEISLNISGKDQIKKKQERFEYERDELLNTNERLSKRCAEKDEMEKKSITTILHLKQLTEKLEQEKAILEKKIKGSEQFGLAARLTLKAKQKVEEEVHLEKKIVEEELNTAKKSMETLQDQKRQVENALDKSKTQLEASYRDLESIRCRCDELATKVANHEQKQKDLYEALATAKNDAKLSGEKATKLKANVSTSKGKSKSEFTVEQLETHLSVLKGRLTCAVCNIRDKQVILSRCRHMFCRQCVDKNVKNRSRKCPACGQGFGVKEVEDIWL